MKTIFFYIVFVGTLSSFFTYSHAHELKTYKYGLISAIPDDASVVIVEESAYCSIVSIKYKEETTPYFAVLAWAFTESLPKVAEAVCQRYTDDPDACNAVHALATGLVELKGAGIARGITKKYCWAARKEYTKSTAEVVTKTYETASAIKAALDAYAETEDCNTNISWQSVNFNKGSSTLLTRTEILFPELSERVLTDSELSSFSSNELSLLRNAIYAMHGYEFHRNQTVIDYFQTQNWYRAISNKTRDEEHVYKYNLNWYERKNIELIKSYEN